MGTESKVGIKKLREGGVGKCELRVKEGRKEGESSRE